MAEIVNLRLARKRKARADREASAAANRAASGRSKQERALTEARKGLAEERLEAHRLRDDDSG